MNLIVFVCWKNELLTPCSSWTTTGVICPTTLGKNRPSGKSWQYWARRYRDRVHVMRANAAMGRLLHHLERSTLLSRGGRRRIQRATLRRPRLCQHDSLYAYRHSPHRHSPHRHRVYKPVYINQCILTRHSPRTSFATANNIIENTPNQNTPNQNTPTQ